MCALVVVVQGIHIVMDFVEEEPAGIVGVNADVESPALTPPPDPVMIR